MREQPIPPFVAHLPIDPHRGIPVPWFVAWTGGGPEFRVADKLQTALKFGLCWVCGRERAVRDDTFVLGPMCAINRTSAEPPSHSACGAWSAAVCPFLTRPHARRRESNMPDGAGDPAGIMLRRNPGVTLLWQSTRWEAYRAPGGGILFDIGDPGTVRWLAHGRDATRAEVVHAIDTGMPALRELAEQEGVDAVLELAGRRRDIERLLPAGAGGR